MEIQLRDLKPNPFRNLPHYPIDRNKIAKLKGSIGRTGFWDNCVARKIDANGTVELAHGHHRRQALLEMYPPDHTVNVIIREFSDADMIRCMADENDENYNMTPAVINETVKAARDFLRSAEGKKEHDTLSARVPPGKRKDGDGPVVAAFLGWRVDRVEEALAEIAEIEKAPEEERKAKKEIIEKMPSQTAAQEFRRQAKKVKAPLAAQRRVAEEVRKGKTGTSEIRQRLSDEKYRGKIEARRKNKTFSKFLDEGCAKIVAAEGFLAKVRSMKKDFFGDLYVDERGKVMLTLRSFHRSEAALFGKSAEYQKLLEGGRMV